MGLHHQTGPRSHSLGEFPLAEVRIDWLRCERAGPGARCHEEAEELDDGEQPGHPARAEKLGRARNHCSRRSTTVLTMYGPSKHWQALGAMTLDARASACFFFALPPRSFSAPKCAKRDARDSKSLFIYQVLLLAKMPRGVLFCQHCGSPHHGGIIEG